MKKLILLILAILIYTGIYAQGPVNIGIKFGTNSSAMLTNIEDVLQQNIQEDQINNYLAGAFVRLNLGRLYAQPEAYFNTKGGIIKPLGENQFSIPTATTFNYQTVDVPVLLGIKLINKPILNLRIHGGPVFSYVTANSFISEISDFNASDLNDRYMGWQVGAGVDLWFLTVDARIENSMNILNTDSNYQARNRAYLLSAGIKLF